MSRLVLFFPMYPFHEVHLSKDVGLFVKYLTKFYFTKAEILKAGKEPREEYATAYFTVKNLLVYPRLYSESYVPLSYQMKCIIASFQYLLKNKDISHVMLFHITHYSVYLSLVMKILLRHIKIYIKLDTAIDGAEKIVSGLTGKNFFGRSVKRWLFPRIDLMSVETIAPHAFLISSPWLKNIELIPNGLDDDCFNIDPESLEKIKSNIMITAGRLGTYQKNTELLLAILKNIDTKGWAFFFIGPVEKKETNFQKTINELYAEFPALMSKVHFIGNVSDKTVLYDYYKRSKVFLFPSRFESFGIAALEAAAFGNYLITTDVGAASDLTNNGQYGFICPQSVEFKQDEAIIGETMKRCIELIIDNKINITDQITGQASFIKKKFMMGDIIKHPAIKKWAAKGSKNPPNV
jgi:glycosyltransferase involved in cell wall biosynthesis